MSSAIRDIAEAFSGHRFAEAYEHLAPDITWVAYGAGTFNGKQAVVSACEETLTQLATTTTTFSRFVSVADEQRAVVDVIATYASDDQTATVASCDIYEFQGDLISRITSYTVEVSPNDED